MIRVLTTVRLAGRARMALSASDVGGKSLHVSQDLRGAGMHVRGK